VSEEVLHGSLVELGAADAEEEELGDRELEHVTN